MAEELVSSKTAKLLEQAGFPQGDCEEKYESLYVLLDDEKDYAVPSLSVAAKWLREEKKVWVQVKKNGHDPNWRSCPYLMDVEGSDSTYPISDYEYYHSYEKALDAGIADSCEWLIAHATNDGSKTE